MKNVETKIFIPSDKTIWEVYVWIQFECFASVDELAKDVNPEHWVQLTRVYSMSSYYENNEVYLINMTVFSSGWLLLIKFDMLSQNENAGVKVLFID